MVMIGLQKGQDKIIIVTLNEKKTLTAPYYLFVFEHQTSKAKVKFIKNSTADESPYPARYNKFTITVNDYFANSLPGEYLYKIYEQASSSNLVETPTTSLVESGKMELLKADADEIERKVYSPTYTRKVNADN